ncbi:MAG: hypothetical protein WC871_02275 [Bacteroidales bacterium]
MMILYMSCHAILEYDELKLFEELGIKYFSLGSYILPWQPADPIRPALTYHPPEQMYAHPAPERDKLTPEFVEPFDTIIAMHVPDWIVNNWPVIKHKRVIWRSIGQSTPKIEAMLAPYRAEGLEVVRYSPREINIEGNIGTDHIIRFYKDEREFDHWIGGGTEAITFAQNMKHRGDFLNVTAYQQLVHGFNARVYGPKNEQMGPLNGGFLSYDGMKQKMRDCRIYVYTGTQPAAYTLSFIEALMTGCPIVALGPKYGNSLKLAGKVYEIADIIHDGVNGFVSNDLEYLRLKMGELVKNKSTASRISAEARKTAIELFGKTFIKEQWRKLLCK